MPKRSTLTFTSEDKYFNNRGASGRSGGHGGGESLAKAKEEEAQRRRVYIYACATSSEPAVLMTDALLDDMPARRTDGARVVDRHKYYVKLNCSEESRVYNVKCAREQENAETANGEESLWQIERQRRFVTSAYGLPVAYVDNRNERFLYIIKDALVLESHA